MEKVVRDAIKKFCAGFSNPVAVIDSAIMCVYSNRPNLIPIDLSLAEMFTKPVKLPLEGVCNTSALINGVEYCVRMMPFEDDVIICEFIDWNMALDITGNSDIYGKLLPVVDELRRDVSSLWRNYDILRGRLEADENGGAARCALGIENYLTCLDSVISNISEYVNIMFRYEPSDTLIDINTLLAGLIGRCNTVLSGCGRYVDFVSEPGTIYIRAHQRHVICAVVNAVQNALLYSPRDCVPYVTLCREDPNDPCGNVILQILNDNALYNDCVSVGEWNVNSRRLGFGIPIIKRFAELAGGSFSLSEENGMVRTVIKLPIVEQPSERLGIGVLSSSHFVYYKSGIPDLLELRMSEVNMLFAE